MANIKTIFIQKPCHFSISVSPKEFCKVDDSLTKFLIERINFSLISLSTTIETNHFAGPTFGDVELIDDMGNGFFFACRA